MRLSSSAMKSRNEQVLLVRIDHSAGPHRPPGGDGGRAVPRFQREQLQHRRRPDRRRRHHPALVHGHLELPLLESVRRRTLGMRQPLREKSRATYANVLAAPRHLVAKIIDGELHLSPRPTFPHARAGGELFGELREPFGRGRGGPGGWIFLLEPELHLGDEPSILVPDIAGWRRERMPVVESVPYTTLAPDWLCEVLSPSTESFDRTQKLAVYA